MDLDHVSKTVFDSALTFTRLGLTVAGSVIGYAAEVLKDVEHEFKSAGDRFQAAAPPADAPVAEPQPDPTPSSK
jgi:hypothetical protein